MAKSIKLKDNNYIDSRSVVVDRTNLYDELYYKDGDKYVLNKAFPCSGFITSSTTTLIVALPVSKNLSNIKNINCTELTAEMRGIKGYLNNQSGFIDFVNNPDYSITCDRCGTHNIRINIQKSSAFTNVSNNTPVVLYINYGSTFEFE